MQTLSPQIGTRISHAGHLGTVRFIGQVDGTQGIWLGVEWDDPTRGRHNGVKDGIRYFECRVPNSGSFIRPFAPSICYGKTFLEALRAKYAEAQRGEGSQETYLLESSTGLISVEAVNFNKVRRKLSDLQNLRVASLDGENVARSDLPQKIRECCPSLRVLNLSSSLIASWHTIVEISTGLPFLEELALNRNRLMRSSDASIRPSPFSSLKDLQLNQTLITWKEAKKIIAFMPNLETLELGYNGLNRLDSCDSLSNSGPSLKVLNLDSNACQDWSHVCRAMQPYHALQRLVLTSNCIDTIPPLQENEPPFFSLRSLSLSSNQLKSWSDVDNLSLWCPNLEALNLSGNPLVEDHNFRHCSRQITIARIPSLVILDGGAVSEKERLDCELFYLSYVSRHGSAEPEAVCREHPRWRGLLSKHGMADSIPVGREHPEKLSSRLIQLNVGQCFSLPPSWPAPAVQIAVLPTMSIRALRLKIIKSFRLSRNGTLDLWMQMGDGSFVQMTVDHDKEELAWWGVENGCNILFYVNE